MLTLFTIQFHRSLQAEMAIINRNNCLAITQPRQVIKSRVRIKNIRLNCPVMMIHELNACLNYLNDGNRNHQPYITPVWRCSHPIHFYRKNLSVIDRYNSEHQFHFCLLAGFCTAAKNTSDGQLFFIMNIVRGARSVQKS